MAYKCKNCGKFVAKDATTCKHCGQENPAELVDTNESVVNNVKGKVAAAPNQIQCPNCGSMLVLPKQFANDYYLTCNICNQQFANPTKSLGRGENFLKKNGCLILCVFMAVVVLISYFTYNGDGIKADATTVYVITKDIYAPSTENAAKAMINSMVRNGNDPISNLDHIYKNDADFTHVFANDKVVVLKKISSGYLIRKLGDYQTAVVPNESYLKEQP